MKHILFTFLLILLPMMAWADDSGSCGDGVTYNYVSSTHTLTISKTSDGTGMIIDTPWNSYAIDIQKVIIETGVTSIGYCAFRDCSNMTSVAIPEGVTSIGNEAFYGCSALTTVTIPKSLTSVGDWAFYMCNSLTAVYISDIKAWCSINFNYSHNNPLECAKHLYLNNKLVTALTIPEGVASIGSWTFEYCKDLVSVTIPNSVTSIGDNAFSGCSGLTSVTIPNSVTSIGGGVFYDCSSLASVTLSNKITSIGDYLFRGCNNLTSVTIPESVTSIGDYAFWGCYSLTSMTIPNKVTSIGYESFYSCGGLKSVSIPNCLTSIGVNAFENCRSLTNVKISDIRAWCNIIFKNDFSNPLQYAHHLYLNNEVVTALTIPTGMTSINNYTFQGCSDLISVVIPNSVTSIGEQAFAGCNSMTSLSLSDNLTIIMQEAFQNCMSLSSLTIPASVQYIYQNAFSGCSSLKEIDAKPTTPPFIYNNTFSDYSVPLKVPSGCIDTYKSAENWKNFTKISDGTKYKLKYVINGEEYKTYELETGTAITPETNPTKEGYTFSGWSEIPETMPAHDVTVTGTFTINKYKLTYIIDGEEYKSFELEYGTSITPEAEPNKEGYTFSGWGTIPETMPANDVTVAGTFTINKYKLTYIVDGEEYTSYEIEYGTSITSEAEPTKEGYSFSGWSEIPETMPANDVTVTGTFTVNKYKITYIIDGKVYLTEEVEYGSRITPPNPGDHEGYDFAWDEYPDTMPAHDITINGTYTATSIEAILASEPDVKIFTVSGKQLNKVQKGINILRYKDGRTRKIVVK